MTNIYIDWRTEQQENYKAFAEFWKMRPSLKNHTLLDL